MHPRNSSSLAKFPPPKSDPEHTFPIINAANEMNKGCSHMVVGVTVDGTWQRRGYTRMKGVVVAISLDSEKVLDVEPMSRNCKSCSSMRRILKDDL